MCRWMAYSGSPIPPAELLVKPKFSLLDQSLHSRMGATTTNGDGFGLGWYTPGRETPAVFYSIEPAWNDRNIRELAESLAPTLYFAHIRASTGSAVQQTNCHPFRFENWLFMHNGMIREFPTLKRELSLQIDPDLYPHVEGSTDSEVLFHLALSLGLRDDPVAGMARAVGTVESAARKHGVRDVMQMTVAVTDGVRIWSFRYATGGTPRTLYVSDAMSVLRELYPADHRFDTVSDETRVVVSEPLSDLDGVFLEVAPSTVLVVQPGEDITMPFEPIPA